MPPGQTRGRGAASTRGRGSTTSRGRQSRGGSNAASSNQEHTVVPGDSVDPATAELASASGKAVTAHGPMTSAVNEPGRLGSRSGTVRTQNSGTTAGAAVGAGRGVASSSLSSKLRPKAVRRDEAEREKIAAEETEKQNQRLAKDAQARARANRSRGRRARGRGPFMGGRGGYVTRTAASAGIFSQSPAALGASEGPPPRGGRAAGSSGGGLPRAAGRSTTQGGYSSAASYRDEQSRVNTDLLNSFTQDYYEDGNEDAGAGRAGRKKKIMPMGLLREPHKEPAVTVATTDEMAAAEAVDGAEEVEGAEEDGYESDLYVDDPDKLHRDDVNLENDTEVWEHVAPKKRGKVRIKQEDGTIVETTAIDGIAALRQPTRSPSAEHKRLPKGKTAKKRGASSKDPEEVAIAADLEKMLDGLGRLNSNDDNLQDGHLENKMFLFQLPPILPPLKSRAKERLGGVIKDEPGDDVLMLDQPIQGTSSAVDLTGEDNREIKKEGGTEAEHDNQHITLRELIGGGGFVGQMNVRKSGKVEMSWGGRMLEMVPGDDVMSLVTAVILEQSDQKTKEPGEVDGKAYGMGRVEGKFVFSPVWGDEEEWEVNKEDLVIE